MRNYFVRSLIIFTALVAWFTAPLRFFVSNEAYASGGGYPIEEGFASEEEFSSDESFASDKINGLDFPLDASISSLLGKGNQCISQDAAEEFWGSSGNMDQHFQLGHDQGNAIETPNIVKNTIWFAIPDRVIRVCFDNQDKNFRNNKLFERRFSQAWEIWRSYLRKNPPRVYSFDRSVYDSVVSNLIPVDWNSGQFVPIAMNYEIMSSCDETSDLRIVIGGDNKEIEQLQQINNHPIAFTQRKFLEHSLKWSKGFIYIADSSTKIRKGNSSIGLNWFKKQGHLENVFLHEIGHVLGVPHIEGTIMRNNLYQFLFLNKHIRYLKEPAIDHQNTLYDNCGTNNFLTKKLRLPIAKYHHRENPNLKFLSNILNIKHTKSEGENALEIGLQFVKPIFAESLSTNKRYEAKRIYHLNFTGLDNSNKLKTVQGELTINLNSQELAFYQPIFNQMFYYRSGIKSPVATVGIKSACYASTFQSGTLEIQGRIFPVSISTNSYKSANRTFVSSLFNLGSGYNIKIDYGEDFAEFQLDDTLR